jgi:CRP/FNR family transcriptional regulator, cyclic AMP receptor protein
VLDRADSGKRLVTPDPELPDDVRTALLARARIIQVKKGHTVIDEGSMSTDAYFIVSGRVQVSVLNVNGRETIIRQISANRMFGELAAIDQQPRSASVIAMEDTQLAYMTATEYLDFLATVPHAALWMVREQSAQVRRLTEAVFELSTLAVGSRLHCELMRLSIAAGIHGDRVEINPAPTHADLASRIGTHREAVTRELRQLASEGIIEQTGRRLTITSIAHLGSFVERAVGPIELK